MIMTETTLNDRTTITLDRETFNYLAILSKQVRIPKSVILKELINLLAHKSAEFSEAKCGYWLNESGDKIIIQFFGEKSQTSGVVHGVKDSDTDESLLGERS